ncbi:GDSL-type esterase/lipase family protein [Rubritalea marina]|uniref:GDSL-type esterase/lipase family protein n=1 Tax=Rubritalea marina TaxID=361055 RepID=UPI000378173D|nr:GDSL-type esterase/lipase family protein [Rubritalea marina]
MKSLLRPLSILLCLCLSAVAQTKIACVGDSITFGAGIPDRDDMSYPAQLGHLLGADYEVKNFGISARTMLSKGDHPYSKEALYKASVNYQPNIVIIKLGTNDSKPHNWAHKAEFKADAKALIEPYLNLEPQPRIILCQPVPVAEDKWGITDQVVSQQIAPLIREVAFETGVETFDFRSLLIDKPQWLPDGVHPNSFGAEAMARGLFQFITTERDPDFTTPLMDDAKVSNFFGYEQQSFSFLGTDCKVVAPKQVAKGAPWVWRARFWGHQPQLDIALLELGWHVAYCDVAGLFGSPEAVARWDKFYYAMQAVGLSEKPLLEGMSRGGLIIHNWAIKHPNRVAGIICDNGVLDTRSWPGGFGLSAGSAPDWDQCKAAYGWLSDAAAKEYAFNPVDQLDHLKNSKIPVLYLISQADKVVPPSENSEIAATKLSDFSLVIRKPGGHHPHSMPNPKVLTSFSLFSIGAYTNPAILPAPSSEYRPGAGWGGGTWWGQFRKINDIAKTHPNLDLIFFGDSITQAWSGAQQRIAQKGGQRAFDRSFGAQWNTASFGISGDRTEHLLYRLNNGNFEGLKPKTVVLMIGINNLVTAKQPADQVVSGIQALVEELVIKLPNTQILLLGTFPANLDPQSKLRQDINTIQSSIASLGDKENVTFLNLNPSFTNADGSLKTELYQPDMLHLSEAGYDAWAAAILPTLKPLMVKK